MFMHVSGGVDTVNFPALLNFRVSVRDFSHFKQDLTLSSQVL